MPKGIRDHTHQGETLEKYRLKIGGADPNNRPEEENTDQDVYHDNPSLPIPVPKGDDDKLLPDELKQIFVQVAALNGLNVKDTHAFMHDFVMPGINHKQVSGLVDKYRADIINARSAVAFYVDQKFPAFNPFKQAETINKGLLLCTKIIDKYSVYVDREPKLSRNYIETNKLSEQGVKGREDDMAAKWVQEATRGLSLITKTYEKWNGQKREWGAMVDALIADFAAQENPAQAKRLDPRKIAAVARTVGVDGFIADRLAQLLVYGEQNLLAAEKTDEEDENSKYFEDDEDADTGT